MTQKTTEHCLLLPEWAFVVQFRATTQVAQGQLVGRVEHVVSGQAARFGSSEELLAFITRVLGELSTQSIQEP